jgi:hypothetical protein
VGVSNKEIPSQHADHTFEPCPRNPLTHSPSHPSTHSPIHRHHIHPDVIFTRATPTTDGCKVFSFEHTPTGRDLLHTPSVVQPIIASVLNAQVDGGIEWNYSPGVLGHWVGTRDDVWAARVKTSRGDVLRIYEFDRFNETAFQVDMFLSNGTLWAHPKTFNPQASELRGYWWTCVGHSFTSPTQACKPSEGNSGSRILSNAEGTFNTGSIGPARYGPWPEYDPFCCQDAGGAFNPLHPGQSLDAFDMSWMKHHLRSSDVFLRISDSKRP